MHTLDLVAIDCIIDYVSDDATHSAIIAAVPLIIPAYISRGGDYAILGRRRNAFIVSYISTVIGWIVPFVYKYAFYMFLSIPVVGVMVGLIGWMLSMYTMPLYIAFTAVIIILIESHLWLACSMDAYLTSAEKMTLHRLMPTLVNLSD